MRCEAGENAVGVMLGNGFFHVPKVANRYTKLTASFGQPKLIARIRSDVPAAGAASKWLPTPNGSGAPGPIMFSHVYGGEDYDARLEETGWNRPGFDDGGWAPALEVSGPGGRLVAQTNPDIRAMEVFRPKQTTEPRAGVRVYDLGQNFSGWPGITVRGRGGRFGEADSGRTAGFRRPGFAGKLRRSPVVHLHAEGRGR